MHLLQDYLGALVAGGSLTITMARENVSDYIIDSGNVITAEIESIAAGGGGEEAE